MQTGGAGVGQAGGVMTDIGPELCLGRRLGVRLAEVILGWLLEGLSWGFGM